MIIPISVRNGEEIFQFNSVPSFHHPLLFLYPLETLSSASGKEQVFEEGKSKIEPQTTPVCLTLFNKAPAVRHRKLNPPHCNICQLKDFNTSVGQCHQAKTD